MDEALVSQLESSAMNAMRKGMKSQGYWKSVTPTCGS